ncbi:MAG: aldo/keto reductase [Calditrichia bacterium]|nr:aldo/keto reductase [Calditrichia bacterium]
MKYRTLGKTDFSVSEIGFGAWAIGGNRFGNSYGTTKDSESIQALQKAIDLGCNFIDTADVYGHGHSEELIGKAVAGKRQDIFIATKVGGDFYHSSPRLNFDPDYIRFALEKSLKRLNTDYIDLYQLHNPPLHLIQDGTIFDIFFKLKTEGYIRAIGLSIFEPTEGVEAIRKDSIDCIQVVFNIFNRQAAKDLFPLARDNNIGIIAREPLNNGLLTGKFTGFEDFEEGDIRSRWSQKYFEHLVNFTQRLRSVVKEEDRSLSQTAIQFVLAQSAVSTVIPGMKTGDQVEENFRSINLKQMTEEELKVIIQYLMHK